MKPKEVEQNEVKCNHALDQFSCREVECNKNAHFVFHRRFLAVGLGILYCDVEVPIIPSVRFAT